MGAVRKSDTGASAIEYAGLIVLAAVLLGGLYATGVTTEVESACKSALCKILGGNCPQETSAKSAPNMPYPPGPTGRSSPTPSQPAWHYGDPVPPHDPISRPTCDGSNHAWTEGLHAHNDYQNGHPLTDALEHGATSVEADVFLDPRGKLVVGHDPHKPPRGALKDLYIDPLKKRAKENAPKGAKKDEGKIYPGRDKPFELTIEIKQKGDENTYKAVRDQIKHLPKNVHVVLTSGRPDVHKLMEPPLGPLPDNVTLDYDPVYKKDSEDADDQTPGCELPTELDPGTAGHRNLAYDARLAKKVTVLNGKWGKGQCGDTDGNGTISAIEQKNLDDYVARAHQLGYQTRFWGVPDSNVRVPDFPGKFVACPRFLRIKSCQNPTRGKAWQALHEAGTDILGTNHLGAGENFIRSCGKKF